MPPRRNTRASAAAAAAAEREVATRSARVVAAGQHAAPALAPLPHALVLHILSLLPVDTRLRCAEVCRSWRAALEERSLWLRLDLSASGVSPKREATDALLHAAAARARGELEALDLRGCTLVTLDTLLAVVTANGALRELRTRSIFRRDYEDSPLDTDELEALMRAAPRLAVCEADVVCTELALAHRLLRNEPPFTPLQLHTFEFDVDEVDIDEADVLALSADFTLHAHLRRLHLNFAPLNTAAALDAVVDAALTRRLTHVTFSFCNLSPESAPALVRLIGGGALAELDIVCGNRQLLDTASALALGNALRASSTLTAVYLRHVNLWRDPAATTALLGALAGHPSLRSLDISDNHVDPADREEAGALIGALVAANAPALHELFVSWCDLGDAGLRPLCDALPANTHLRNLGCGGNKLSDAFVRDSLLPAVRANSSLRWLTTELQTDAAREAEALVLRRADAQ
jgi:hypothetical protein